MIEKVEAFKCSSTGRLFALKKDAIRCEFEVMMCRVGGNLPPMGSVRAADVMEWLADRLTDGVYPTAFDGLCEAIDFWRAHRAARSNAPQELVGLKDKDA